MYYVHIEDDHACTLNVNTHLSMTPALVVSASSTAILCNGDLSTVSATSTGGDAPTIFTIGTTVLPAQFPPDTA
jgi:hypothetical protein